MIADLLRRSWAARGRTGLHEACCPDHVGWRWEVTPHWICRWVASSCKLSARSTESTRSNFRHSQSRSFSVWPSSIVWRKPLTPKAFKIIAQGRERSERTLGEKMHGTTTLNEVSAPWVRRCTEPQPWRGWIVVKSPGNIERSCCGTLSGFDPLMFTTSQGGAAAPLTLGCVMERLRRIRVTEIPCLCSNWERLSFKTSHQGGRVWHNGKDRTRDRRTIRFAPDPATQAIRGHETASRADAR